MEHLVVAIGGQWTDEDVVPYVAKDDYHGVPFLQYAGERDAHEEVVWAQTKSDNELNVFFQTALFFCFFHNVLGNLFDPKDYIKKRTDLCGSVSQVLCTEKLESAILSWEAYARDHLEEVKKGQGHLAMFTRAAHICWLARNGRVSRSISLSASSSLNLLLGAVARTLSISELKFGIWVPTVPLTEDLQIMVKQGWCPCDADRSWRSFLHMETKLLTRTLPKTIIENHDGCTKDRCSQIHIDTAKFSVKHTENTCSCDLWSVDTSKLAQIIESGGLPLLVAHPSVKPFSSQNFDEIELKLVASTADTPYIVISHVWKDGLANPSANALPKCQLYQLMSRISEFTESQSETFINFRGHFWLDPICCPVSPPNLKAKVLSSMAKIYKDSHMCLVWEASLRATRQADLDPTNIAMHVITSKWVRRLWTLQEAMLPPRLLFVFADGNVDMQTLRLMLFKEDHDNKARIVGKKVYMDISLALFNLHRQGKGLDGPSYAYLQKVKNLATARSVSVPADEALCLRTLLGDEVTDRELLEGDGMARFWTSAVERDLVPAPIIFYHAPRLKVNGFGWAPSSLLLDNNPSDSDLHFLQDDSVPRGKLSARGLHVSYAGFLLDRPKMPAQQQFDLQDSKEGPWIPWIMVREEEHNRWWSLHHRWPPFEDQEIHIDEESCLAIILANRYNDRWVHMETGVLVTGDEVDDDGTRYVRHHGLCYPQMAGANVSKLSDLLMQEPVDTVDTGDPLPSYLEDLAWDAIGEIGFIEAHERSINADLVPRFVGAISNRIKRGQFFTIRETFTKSQKWVVG